MKGRGWRPVCEECHEDKKPENVTTLRSQTFCRNCLTKALARIDQQKAKPVEDEE